MQALGNSASKCMPICWLQLCKVCERSTNSPMHAGITSPANICYANGTLQGLFNQQQFLRACIRWVEHHKTVGRQCSFAAQHPLQKCHGFLTQLYICSLNTSESHIPWDSLWGTHILKSAHSPNARVCLSHTYQGFGGWIITFHIPRLCTKLDGDCG